MVDSLSSCFCLNHEWELNDAIFQEIVSPGGLSRDRFLHDYIQCKMPMLLGEEREHSCNFLGDTLLIAWPHVLLYAYLPILFLLKVINNLKREIGAILIA